MGKNWTFNYTNMGRIFFHKDPLGNIWQYSYDNQGRLSQITYPTGETQTLTYDSTANLVKMLFSDGTELEFTYDALDRLLSTKGISFTRDAEGNIINSRQDGINFGASYDDGGRFKTATYNNNQFTVTYEYNEGNLLTRVSDDLTGTQIDFTYDNDRRLIEIIRSNGVRTTFTWDNASRPTQIKHGTLANQKYTWDAADQITRVDHTLPLDPADYLTAGIDEFTYDDACQVNSTGYTYDERGRLTATPQTTFAWNGRGRLTGIGSSINMDYNGLGYLMTRTEGGNTSHYFYNYALEEEPIVAEKDEEIGQFRRFYVWTPDGCLLYMIDAQEGNKVYFYHFDYTGSTLFLADAEGNITDSYAYTPYGKLLAHQGDNDQPFTFVGRFGVRQEGDSGNLYHMRARYYDAGAARFISRDPIWPNLALAQEINPYIYALNNPTGYTDYKGTCWIFCKAGKAIGKKALKEMMERALKKAIKEATKKVGKELGKNAFEDLLEGEEIGFDFDLFDFIDPSPVSVSVGMGTLYPPGFLERWNAKMKELQAEEKVIKEKFNRYDESFKEAEKKIKKLTKKLGKVEEELKSKNLCKRAREDLEYERRNLKDVIRWQQFCIRTTPVLIEYKSLKEKLEKLRNEKEVLIKFNCKVSEEWRKLVK